MGGENLKIEHAPPQLQAPIQNSKDQTISCALFIIFGIASGGAIGVGIAALFPASALCQFNALAATLTLTAGSGGVAFSIFSLFLQTRRVETRTEMEVQEEVPPPEDEPSSPALEESKPLLKAVSEEHFWIKTFNKSDTRLLNVPLCFFLDPSLEIEKAKDYLTILAAPFRKNEILIIKKRVQEFEEEIQLTEKMKEMNDTSLTLRDLLPAWSASPIRFSLLKDEELATLTISSIKDVDNSVLWKTVGSRIFELASEKEDFEPPENLDDLLLIDLCHLTAKHIHTSPRSFPPITFLLLDTYELQELDASQLLDDQVLLIFQSYRGQSYNKDYFIRKLTPEQINQCAAKIADVTLFSQLTENQALQFDYNLMSPPIFSAIFSTVGDRASNAATFLPKLPIESIYRLSPFFAPDHWKYIGEKHTLDFDFSQMAETERQKVFDILFRSANRLIGKLELNKLYDLIPFFNDSHWAFLSKKQIKDFDYTKLEGLQNKKTILGTIFSIQGEEFSRAAIYLPLLKSEQIEIIKDDLGPDALKYLNEKIISSSSKFAKMSDEELKKLQIADIDPKENKELWDAVGSRLITLGAQRLPNEGILLIDLCHFSASQINANPKDFPPITLLLIPKHELKKIETNKLTEDQLDLLFSATYISSEYQSEYHFVNDLSIGQVNQCVRLIQDKKLLSNLDEFHAVNFELAAIDQEAFDSLFTIGNGGIFTNAALYLPRLAIDKIYGLQHFFSDGHWQRIGEEHAKALDFSRIDESRRQKVFDILFGIEGAALNSTTSLLLEMPTEKIQELSPYFAKEHWERIGPKHTKAFDYSIIKEEDRPWIFNILFSSEGTPLTSKARLLKDLPPKQLEIVREYINTYVEVLPAKS